MKKLIVIAMVSLLAACSNSEEAIVKDVQAFGNSDLVQSIVEAKNDAGRKTQDLLEPKADSVTEFARDTKRSIQDLSD